MRLIPIFYTRVILAIAIVLIIFFVRKTWLNSSIESLAVYDSSGAQIINYPTMDTSVSVDKIRFDANNTIEYHLPASEIAKQYHVGMYLLDGGVMSVLPWHNYLIDACSNMVMNTYNRHADTYIPSYVDSILLSPSYRT